MLRWLLQLLLLVPAFAFAQDILSPQDARKAEETMAHWLAHPSEFGVRPKRVAYLRSVATKMAGRPAPVSVDIVEYEMPDGTYGRGLANPVTWSFLGPIPYDKLGDDHLVTAYCGWLWLFSATQDGRVKTDYAIAAPSALVSSLASEGIVDVKVSARYTVRTSEFFEFTGRRGASTVKGAGSAGSRLVLESTAPQASLPVVYTYLGMVMRGAI